MADTLSKDFTSKGTKLFGQYENDRNAASRELIHNVLQVVISKDVQTIIAHHLCYQVQEDDYFIVEEIPSLDTLIFDHDIGKKLWGDDMYAHMRTFAQYPCESRDAAFSAMFYNRFPKETGK